MSPMARAVGRRLVLDGVNAVRVTFRCDAPENAQCFVIVNTVTDRNRDHLDAFRLEGMPGSRVHVLACALPADAILSYQFAIVDAGGIDPRTSMDRGDWLRLSQAARPDCSNVRSLINGRGKRCLTVCGTRCERCVAIGEPPLSADACCP